MTDVFPEECMLSEREGNIEQELSNRVGVKGVSEEKINSGDVRFPLAPRKLHCYWLLFERWREVCVLT